MKNLTIHCKDFDLTDAIKNYLTEKLSHLLRYLHHNEDDISFNCRLGKVANSKEKGKIYYVEISIHTPDKNYGSRIEAENTYEAIDLIKDDLASNITHHKDKMRTLNKKMAQEFKEELRDTE